MLEKTIQEILTRFPGEVWPDLSLVFVESYRRLPNGNIIDIHYKDPDNVHWILELKRASVTPRTVQQVMRYLKELKEIEPTLVFRGMVVAPAISANGRRAAESHDIIFKQLDEERLTKIARAHKLTVNHSSGHRPRLAGSRAVKSRPKRKGATHPGTPEAEILSLRKLDERFPPGSLDGRVGYERILNYWKTCAPDMPAEHIETAARLTFEVLKALPHAALSNRSPGKSDPYTTIRGLDGRIAAAIDARKTYVKFDFPLPSKKAKECREDGLLTIWKPRGYSIWVQSKVGKTLTAEKAIVLARIGIAFEFDGIEP